MSDGAGSLGHVKIPYYVVAKGRGYWRPTPRMKGEGFIDVRCGVDGPQAWLVAETWNKRWQAARRGEKLSAIEPGKKQSVEQAEIARIYPPRSVGHCFQRFIQTPEWRSKAASTRRKIWWPAWHRIRDMWGDFDPNVITFEDMSQWREDLEHTKSLDVAHKTIKVWRSLWKVMAAMKVAIGADPSSAVRNESPQPRNQTWTEGEAVQLIKHGWRAGFRGAACIMALCWDTLFSPVDVRTLTPAHRRYQDAQNKTGLWFDRSEEGRAKTGRAAMGTLSRRTERLVVAYLGLLGAEPHPDAPLFRMRSGVPYREDTLAHDFADIREAVFPGDARQLRDMRRSGTAEAVVGDTEPLQLSTKLANSIERSNTLHKTYAPNISIAPVLEVDRARVRGRRKIRDKKSG